jgi:hypothetical protein
MYAAPGIHPYVLPLGLLYDVTDRGPLWDPVLNSHMYKYNLTSDTLFASTLTPNSSTEWFNFRGHWGDKFYPLSDDRQYMFAGQYHYVSGPLGPRFKSLGRKKVCPGSGRCELKRRIGDESIKKFIGVGEGEDWPDEEIEHYATMHKGG